MIFDATTDYVVQSDRRGRITYMNPASRRHNGLAPDAPVGHLRYADFNPPEMLERYRRVIVPTALAQGVWVGETIALDLSGQRTVCSHMLIAHRDKRGRLEHFSAVMRDISAEQAAAQALARNEQTLRSLADTMPAIVAVIDKQQRYRFVNASFERWYQVSRDTIAGRAVRDVVGEHEYRHSEPYIERVLAGEAAVYDKAYHESGSRRHLEVHYTPLRAADGSVDGYVLVANDITARKEEEQRLRELTRVDPLTGLLNRNGFDEHLRDCTERAQRDEELLALLYIDLDHFKQVNDRHGHPVGDELLKIFAKRMRNAVRPGDAVARLGGDEFAIVLAGLKAPSNAERVADKVLAAAQAPFNVGKLSLRVSASVGVAYWQRGDRDGRLLVERADAMLYRAKQGGRGRRASADPQD